MGNIIYYREPECDGTVDETEENEYFNELLMERYSNDYRAKVKAVGETL